jgi:hypothetical protein
MEGSHRSRYNSIKNEVVPFSIIVFSSPVTQWLRHYATNRKVAGWIPDEEIF